MSPLANLAAATLQSEEMARLRRAAGLTLPAWARALGTLERPYHPMTAWRWEQPGKNGRRASPAVLARAREIAAKAEGTA